MPPHGATPDHKRRQQITSLRAAGLTFRVIGERLGITRQTAYALSYRRRVSRGEVHCKACDGSISASRDEKANRPVYCLACLAKRPEATFGERVKAYRGMRCKLPAFWKERRFGKTCNQFNPLCVEDAMKQVTA